MIFDPQRGIVTELSSASEDHLALTLIEAGWLPSVLVANLCLAFT